MSRLQGQIRAATADNPSQLGALGLWLDAYMASPGALASWIDASGSGRGPTQVVVNSRPTASASAFGGKPGVVFDGGSDFMNLPAWSLTEFHLFAVIRRDIGDTNGTLFQAGGSGTESVVVAINDDTSSGPVYVRSGSRIAKGSCLDAGKSRVLYVGATASGTSPSCFTVADTVQSYSMSSTSSAYTSAPTASRLGCAVASGASDRFFTGVIAELLVFTSLQSGASDIMLRRLAQKWQ